MSTPHTRSSAPTFAHYAELKHYHAIVCGYGPVGRMVVRQLEAAGLAVTIIEMNAETVETQRRLEKTTILGDVTQPETLKAANIDKADALIITIPNEDAALAACELARELNPEIFIAARTSYLSKGMLCSKAGADHVIVEEVITAEAMQHAVIQNLLGITSPA